VLAEHSEDARVAGAERAVTVDAVDVEHADHLALTMSRMQRAEDVAAGLLRGRERRVVVVQHQGFAVLGDVAGDALADLDARHDEVRVDSVDRAALEVLVTGSSMRIDDWSRRVCRGG
jgi:hypothetical protein